MIKLYRGGYQQFSLNSRKLREIIVKTPFLALMFLILNILFPGGLGFASVMRGENFITMIDPFQKKYGDVMGVLLFLPALLAETLWSAAILGTN